MSRSWHPVAGAALLAIAGTANMARAADAKPCGLSLYASLPMTAEPDGRVSIPVTVQDKNYSFLVDTGGAVATLGWDQAEELGLRKRTADNYLSGIGGRYLSSVIIVDNFAIGKMTGSDLNVYVEPRSELDYDGTLAPDMLRHFDVDFDFAHDRLNLFSQDHCPGKVAYWSRQGAVVVPMQMGGSWHIRVPITLDGKNMTAILDTGAATSIMSMHAANELGIRDDSPDLRLNESSGYRKQQRMYTYPFKTLDIGGINVKNPQVVIASNDIMGDFQSDMILGIGIMRQLHLYIAYKEEKLYITPASENDGAAGPASADRSAPPSSPKP